MTKPKLHLDMDASRRDLYQALLSKGHDVTRTPNPDVSQDASDEYHLLWATSHQRIVFSFNIRDFIQMAKKHPYHSGILLANQRKVQISRLISTLDRILTETSAEEWVGQVHWINEWI
ncbi:MAG: DUF5615 family PIN-like protein [Chloroflexota bacterium]